MNMSQASATFQFLRPAWPREIAAAQPPLGVSPALVLPTGWDPEPAVWRPGRPAALVSGRGGEPPVVRVGNLWLLRETVTRLSQPPWSRAPLDIARAAGSQDQGRLRELSQGLLTPHALLVAWGEYAADIGLLQKLSQVALPQKGVIHAPQAKLLAFLLSVLSGLPHLKDWNEGPHPLAHDWVALRAWGLAAPPHYTGISRTLAACDPPTVAAVTQMLQEISRPFVVQEVARLRQQQRPLLVDLDLAPRRVSNTSTTFPGAEFGWQGDQVGLGYDAALATLRSPTYGRLLLVGFHHPRHPLALPRLQAMVQAVEAQLGVRPRRRPELVQQRLAALRPQLTQRLNWLEAQLRKQQALQARLQALPGEIARLEETVTTLEAAYRQQDRPERPHSQLAQARHALARAQARLAQVPPQLQQAAQATATHQARLAALQAEHDALTAHLAQLQADNAANSDPVVIILRMDAGFGTGENLAWVIELGYIVYTKAHNAQVATSLLAQLAPDARWTPVGRNAELRGYGQQQVTNCPYPLTVAVERFHTPEEVKHSALLAYRDDGRDLTLPAWFAFYNARQTIEAGIKESNVVFQMHPLKMRSPGGIALQEQFALFAANFVRWAAVWLRQRLAHSTPHFDQALQRVKAMVRVGANTSAWVVAAEEDLLLKFDDTGAYPGVELRLAGAWRTRPPLLPRKKVEKSDFGDDLAFGCT